MKKKLVIAVAVGALCVSLAACAPSQTDTGPKPSRTPVPTTSQSPAPGVETPLATNGYGAVPISVEVYDVKAWSAAKGCDCSAPGQSSELYPAGSAVWAVRIDLVSNASWTAGDPNRDAHIDTANLSMAGSWGPGAPVPVSAGEGKTLSKDEGLGWGFESVQSPTAWPWGETRSYLETVYVPRGAASLQLELTIPPTGTRYNTSDPITVTVDIPVPDAVSELTYTGSND